jgi:predicted nucleic acid-binding protein
MEEILIDTDVVLNVLLREEPFFETSAKVFARLERGDICGFLTATTMTNIYYIAQKRAGSEVARLCVRKLLETPGLKFLSVDEQVLRRAEASKMTDFEDAVQAAAAKNVGIKLIVTRNIRDFRHSPVFAVQPEDFLEKLI